MLWCYGNYYGPHYFVELVRATIRSYVLRPILSLSYQLGYIAFFGVHT